MQPFRGIIQPSLLSPFEGLFSLLEGLCNHFDSFIQPFRGIMQPFQGITHLFRGSTHAFRRVVDAQHNFPVITPLRRIDSLIRVEGKKHIRQNHYHGKHINRSYAWSLCDWYFSRSISERKTTFPAFFIRQCKCKRKVAAYRKREREPISIIM